MGHNWIGILQPKDATKPAQPGGCVQCHPGTGNKPNPVEKLTQADYDNVDCLLCHAPNYSRIVAKEGDAFKLVPAQNVDVLNAARNAQKPTSDMCNRCHAGAGGGPNAKHGVSPTPATDVHMAKGLVCVDCHTSKQHKVAGGADIKAQEMLDVKVECANCHTAAPHKGDTAGRLNEHTAKIACQTCHIPAIARDPALPTVVDRDWTKPVLNQNIGLYGPTNKMAGNVIPEYHWWNRVMKVPPEPVGSRGDGKSKIMAWKRANYTVFADEKSGQVIYMKAGVYSVTGDVNAAVKKGAEDAKQSYSGNWKPASETMAFTINHQVAPAKQGLSCQDCHVPNGRLNFAALGYDPGEVDRLTTQIVSALPAASASQTPAASQAPVRLPAAGGVGTSAVAITLLTSVFLVGAGVFLRRRKQ